MADFPGISEPRLMQTEFAGTAADRIVYTGHVALDSPVQPTAYQSFDLPLLGPTDTEGGPLTRGPYTAAGQASYSGGEVWRDVGVDWFDIIHVIPRRIDLGNILGTIQIEVELFNAFRDTNRSLDAFVNNAGDGVTFLNLPGLPTTINALDGLVLTLEVTTSGPPEIDGTLDFQFDIYDAAIPITGSRIVLFPFRPEAPVEETLEFLTDILLHLDGTEQRIALRLSPRQLFRHEVVVEDGYERAYLDNLLFDWQSRVFGLPIWHEPSFSTGSISSGATSVQVDDTRYGDFRVGGLAIVYQDEQTFDTLQVTSITDTLITFASPVTNDYPADTEIMPVRTAVLESNLRGERPPVNMAERRLEWTVIDNENDIADASAWPTFNGKVFLNDPNFLPSGRLREGSQRRIIIFDGETGPRGQISTWTRSKRSHSKGFATKDRQTLWEVRQLLHALSGPQTSFHLPTFSDEMRVVSTISNGSTVAEVENRGYARFVQSRSPRNVLRLELFDGTVIIRTITNAAEVSPTVEQLTIDTGWPQDIEPEEIRRIDIIEKVRIASDRVKITHTSAKGDAEILLPVQAVFE